MDQRPPMHLLAYETWEDAGGLHAKYTGVISDLARANGVVGQVDADNPAELLRLSIGNRIRAWAYERWKPREGSRAAAAARHQP